MHQYPACGAKAPVRDGWRRASGPERPVTGTAARPANDTTSPGRRVESRRLIFGLSDLEKGLKQTRQCARFIGATNRAYRNRLVDRLWWASSGHMCRQQAGCGSVRALAAGHRGSRRRRISAERPPGSSRSGGAVIRPIDSTARRADGARRTSTRSAAWSISATSHRPGELIRSVRRNASSRGSAEKVGRADRCVDPLRDGDDAASERIWSMA